MEKQEFDRVKLGMKVGFVYGPGEFPQHKPGTIMAKVEDRWGFHVAVCEDNGNQVSVEGFMDKGVGCYLLDKVEVSE